jgi:L-threonylcarbamoyladenylate synthase
MSNSPSISDCTFESILQAALALRSGHLVAFPTETVYGLGADASNEKAVNKVYRVKERPLDHPLIVHVSSFNRVKLWVVDIPEYAYRIADEFWPGPVTLILKRSNLARDFITGGQDSVGIRIPSHPIALQLLEQFEKLGGLGVVAPSANRFGRVSATSAQDVEDELGHRLGSKDLILNGGYSEIGIESSIVDCRNLLPRIIRPGAVTKSLFSTVTNFSEKEITSDLRVSGSLSHHYSPSAKVFLDKEPTPGQGFLALAKFSTPQRVIRLGSPKTHHEFARILYSTLRRADNLGIEELVIWQPEGEGLEVAIRDRLKRASQN